MKDLEDTTNIKKAITKDTAVSIGVAIIMLGAMWWLNDQLHSINLQLLNIRMSIVDRWGGKDMKIWSQELQIKNPAISVPSVTLKPDIQQ